MKIKIFIKRFKKLTFKKFIFRCRLFFLFKILNKHWCTYFFYKSYWHSLLNVKKRNKKSKIEKNYMSINVNPGAGIGHQISNYNSGIWFAKKFDLFHAHSSFSDKKWEKLLNFGSSSIHSKNIIKSGYQKILLPIFDEKNSNEISKVKKIIESYRDKKIIFFLEFDQYYKKQYEVAPIIEKKFFISKERKKDKIIFKKKYYNIAVHVRAGDITSNKKIKEKRFLDVDYFILAINKALSIIKTKKKIKIHIFSQFYDSSFLKFNKFKNIHFFYHFNQYKTFLHFVYSDLLITSKSSFSYKAGLISKNIKIAPKVFWHSYPKNDKKWILLNR